MVGINTITFVMHAEAYQEASDGSTLLTLLFDPPIAAVVLFKDWGNVSPIPTGYEA